MRKPLVFLAAFIFPALALAQAAAEPLPAPDMFATIVTGIAAVLVPVLVAVARMFLKDSADKTLETVKWAIGVAYNTVNEISLRTANKVDDKAALALKVFADAMASQGIQATPSQLAMAKASLVAMHGQEKLALKVAAAHP